MQVNIKMAEQLCFFGIHTTGNIQRPVFLTTRSMTEMQLSFKPGSLTRRQQIRIKEQRQIPLVMKCNIPEGKK